jgi:hypothetical protein
MVPLGTYRYRHKEDKVGGFGPDSMELKRGRPTVVVSDGPILVQEWHEKQSQLLGHVAVVHSKVVLKIVTLLYDGLC